jgi:hypothetical protein
MGAQFCVWLYVWFVRFHVRIRTQYHKCRQPCVFMVAWVVYTRVPFRERITGPYESQSHTDTHKYGNIMFTKKLTVYKIIIVEFPFKTFEYLLLLLLFLELDDRDESAFLDGGAEAFIWRASSTYLNVKVICFRINLSKPKWETINNSKINQKKKMRHTFISKLMRHISKLMRHILEH